MAFWWHFKQSRDVSHGFVEMHFLFTVILLMTNMSETFLQKLCVLKGFCLKPKHFHKGYLAKCPVFHMIFLKKHKVLKRVLISLVHINWIFMNPIVFLQ